MMGFLASKCTAGWKARTTPIDFKIEQLGKETRNFMRIRSMRSVPFDSELHLLKVAENLEVSLEK